MQKDGETKERSTYVGSDEPAEETKDIFYVPITTPSPEVAIKAQEAMNTDRRTYTVKMDFLSNVFGFIIEIKSPCPIEAQAAATEYFKR